MTRKHYQIIAEAIRLSTDLGQPHLVHKDQLTSELICKLRADNPRFDGFKFLEACNRA